MITIKELLNQFDLDLDLPDHILNLKFYGNYKNYSKIIDDSESPTEIFHQFIDEENGYFLFSACGCNPLYFYAEEINGKDYQKTYTA